ncbi:MAG: hypothetical protein C0P74_010070 [Gammaproteobacteria bacterium]|nr:hypothetical protein [Gammaproteobacteria bacterium]
MNKRTQLDTGVVVWASFLGACAATMVFFAFVDPLLIGDDDSPPVWIPDRKTGYALGFFFFWLMCALSSALTAFLLETRSTDPSTDRSL